MTRFRTRVRRPHGHRDHHHHHHRSQPRRDRGTTLVELMVTLALTSAVIAVVAGGLVTATKMMGSNALRLQEVSENKVAIEAMTKTLRTAVEPRLLGSSSDAAAFIQGNARQVAFYAALSSLVEPTGAGMTQYGPVRVTYTLASGALTETYQLPDPHLASNRNYTYCAAGSPGCSVRSRVLARNLANTVMFTYYGESQNTLAVPLSAGNLEAVDSIDIVVTSQTSQRDESSTVVSRVSLVNSGTNPTAGPVP
ncbi:MAG: type II secretion system protein [Candidatus Nanopelagicales bacterium]